MNASRTSLDLRLDSPGQLALAAVLVWVVGTLVHPLAILAPLGVLLLLVAGIAYLLRPKNQTMYWRGRRIDLDDRSSAGQRVYHMLFRR
jgi:cbb3-type cytochrome oxidase subunit 3